MKIFVTGGNGFIGSAVVRRLAGEGHAVRCLLRPTSKTSRLEGVAYERVEGDVRDASSVQRGLAGCEGAIHLASLSAWDQIDSPLMDEVVEGGTRNLLAAAAAQGQVKVVFVSSILAVNGSRAPKLFDERSEGTLPDSKLKDSRSKKAAEAMCRQAAAGGQHVVIVNPGEVYGPGDTELITAGNLIDFVKSSPVLVCSGGTLIAHVDDVALGIVRALERGKSGDRYILGGENLTVRQLAELTLELVGKRASVFTFPTLPLQLIASVAMKLHLSLPFNPHVVPYATKYWFMDSRKAKEELGVTFRSARESLAPTLQWLRESGRIP